MQITLEQTEIELAVTKYINEQVNIKEGMQINITLRAGRGETGFTANIDIAPVAIEPVTAPVTPVKRVAAQVKTAEKTLTTSGATVETGSANTVGKPVVETVEPEPENTEQEQVAQKGEETVVQEEPQKRSLFGSLKKPVNE